MEEERLILNGLGAIILAIGTQENEIKLSIHHNQVTQTQETANMERLNALEIALVEFLNTRD